jgi:hypothetical protein
VAGSSPWRYARIAQASRTIFTEKLVPMFRLKILEKGLSSKLSVEAVNDGRRNRFQDDFPSFVFHP